MKRFPGILHVGLICSFCMILILPLSAANGKGKSHSSRLAVRNIHFNKRILKFEIRDFERKDGAGRLKLNMVIRSEKDGGIQYSSEILYRPVSSSHEASVDLGHKEAGDYHVMIEITDLYSGKTAFEYFRMKAGRFRNEVTLSSGSGWIDSEPESIVGEGHPASPALEEILAGAAGYCKKLGERVFHYFCRETVVSKASRLVRVHSGLIKKERLYFQRYILDYQLIKTAAGRIVEQRKKMTAGKRDSGKNFTEMNTSFFSERPVFAPIMILGEEGQKKFRFSMEGFRDEGGGKSVRIRAVPLVRGDFFFTSAMIDLDMSDYSVIRMFVVPRYIKGYHELVTEAFNLGAKLFLECEITFEKIYKGLRFPTSITIIERYRGGLVVSSVSGTAGFIKSQTQFKYTDYRFFNVEMDVRKD